MLLWSLALLNLVVVLATMGSMAYFAERYPSVSTREDLDRYRVAVTIWMCATLAAMALAIAMPLAILGPSLLAGTYVEASWWPIAVACAPMLLRSKNAAILAKCQHLQVDPALFAEYDAINRVWVNRALPRFSDATSSEGRPAPSSDREAYYRTLRDDTYDVDVELRRDAYVLTGIGLGELIFGGLSIAEATTPINTFFSASMLLLGLVTFVGATLLTWRMELGYRISLVCAALHIPLLPLGTGCGLWTLTSMRGAKAALSPEYREALRQAPAEVRLPTWRFALIALVLVHLMALNLLLIDLALFFVQPQR